MEERRPTRAEVIAVLRAIHDRRDRHLDNGDTTRAANELALANAWLDVLITIDNGH